MPSGVASHQNQDRLLPGWEKRKGTYPNVKFDFLGYCFRPRWVKKSQDNSMFCGFNPAVSPSALKTMRSTIRDLSILMTNAAVAGGHRTYTQPAR